MVEEKKALNEKLAEWAGFKSLGKAMIRGKDKSIILTKCKSPTGHYGYAPNFTQSTDLCLKWLVSKLQDKGHNVELYAYEHKGYRATIYREVFSQRGSDGFDPWLEPISQAKNNNSALALCLAIEKLIDSGKI